MVILELSKFGKNERNGNDLEENFIVDLIFLLSHNCYQQIGKC